MNAFEIKSKISAKKRLRKQRPSSENNTAAMYTGTLAVATTKRIRKQMQSIYCVRAHKCIHACSCTLRTCAHACKAVRICTYEHSVHFRSPLSQFPTWSKGNGWTTSFPVMQQVCAVNNIITTNGALTETHGLCKAKHNVNCKLRAKLNVNSQLRTIQIQFIT